MARFIAEWEPQAAIMLTWPHVHSSWLPTLAQIEPVYEALVAAISETQDVIVLCYDESLQQALQARFQDFTETQKSHLKLCIVPTNDTWIRDYGPLSMVEDLGNHFIKFTFNAWGGKYPAELDNQAAISAFQQQKPALKLRQSHALVLEGGSLETDGAGTLLTTSQCLLNPNRNPHLTQAQIENTLKETLGLKRILWLHHGHLEGDDTDSHVDMLARFVGPQHICYTCCEDRTDSHYESHQAMKAELHALRTADDKPYQLTALPWPTAKYNEKGERMAASYANFLITNDLVLMPTYNDPADDIALEKLQRCFPSRRVLGIPSLPLIRQCGSIHCATMQLARQ